MWSANVGAPEKDRAMKTTRKHLIEATKELHWERGYEAMSPRAVLERSGAGQGSLYHHFRGKAELVSTALDEIGTDMTRNLST
ncbi:helix-turn-helix domain-containing protein [Dictyobacter formicarum]|uniref:HTH tetR-type domain-containing protein n=1 Tax=Dictyobacter formicarum TaxID=2778368 RepID=A0ABQ3VP74_9CHLR|nr:helix-turn-helix domain-containing protein [Dictyobacter formicarum]GHO87191.1 hypothetical protein KSZ_51970 [Dictyobacter formicarum]